MSDDKITEEETPGEEEFSGIRGLPGPGEFPSEDEIEMNINVAGADAGISPLDPDFLLFALPFAFIVDAIDVALKILGFLVVTEIISAVIDLLVLLILGRWMYRRLGKIEESKREYQEKLQQAVQKGIQRLSKVQKTGEVPQKVFDRYMRLYGKQMGKIGRATARATARATRRPLTRTLIRGGLTFLGEIAFIIGIMPFWTIMVLLTLREK